MEKQEKKNIVPERPYRNVLTFKLESDDMEHPIGVSETVPNEALTLRQIMERSQQGPMTVQTREAIYGEVDADFDDHDLEKVGHLDISEQRDMLAESKREIAEQKKTAKEYTAKLEADKKAKQKEDEDLLIELKAKRAHDQSQKDKGSTPKGASNE